MNGTILTVEHLEKSKMPTLKLISETWKPHQYAGIFSSLKSRWVFWFSSTTGNLFRNLTTWYSAGVKQILRPYI